VVAEASGEKALAREVEGELRTARCTLGSPPEAAREGYEREFFVLINDLYTMRELSELLWCGIFDESCYGAVHCSAGTAVVTPGMRRYVGGFSRADCGDSSIARVLVGTEVG
jgi:hypothetical protein